MRAVSDYPLWIGNAGDLWDAREVLAVGIEAVIELADNEPFANLPREMIRCRYPISDGGDNPSWLLRLAVESVLHFLRANVPTLICCSAGMSRSVVVAAAGIALIENRSLDESLDTVIGNGPADVSPRLLNQIRLASFQ